MKVLKKSVVIFALVLLCMFLDTVADPDCEDEEQSVEGSQSGEEDVTKPPCKKKEGAGADGAGAGGGKNGYVISEEQHEENHEITPAPPPPNSPPNQGPNWRGHTQKKGSRYSSITVGDTVTDTNSSTVYFQHSTNERSQTRWTHFASPQSSRSNDDDHSYGGGGGRAPARAAAPMPSFAFGGFPAANGMNNGMG